MAKVKKKVVWFNHWFSALAISIQKLKKAFPDVRFIGTNESESCTYRDCVHKFRVEPIGVSKAGYVEWALQFCKDNKVDVFWPKKHRDIIAFHKGRFEEIGTKVISDDFDVIHLFESKSKIYEKLKKDKYPLVPEYYCVRSLKGFRKAYKTLKNEGHTVIAKFDSDEGASSFRIILDEDMYKAEALNGTSMNVVSYQDYCRILSDLEDRDLFRPILVMPKLEGPEVSVDCCPRKDGSLVAVPRYKLGNRVKEVVFNPQLIEDVNWLKERWGFEYPFNVQYRWDKEGNPKLLEINTRISGGAHLSALCGFDSFIQTIADALDVDSKQHTDDMREVKITQYETPVVLKYMSE